MAPPQGAAAYKKRSGIIAISKDRKSVSWSPDQPPDAAPVLVISAASITNLQQTPESSAKVMLKIFAQDPGKTEPVAHVFNFTSASNARDEANAVKEALSNVIQAQKAAQTAAESVSAGSSAALAIAAAVSGSGKGSRNSWEDDEKLKADVALQQAIMRDDPQLQKTFMEARSLKPDSISNTQFTAQFWASRVNLLRRHALIRAQNVGTYNVFSSLRREEGGTKMNLTQEHVKLIFAQYPFMRTVYDEVVPKKLDEMAFWSRFFQSKLYNKLRGLKINDAVDNKDAVLDQFLDRPELSGLRATSHELHIPKTIDLEGNEENHSQRQGNRPDVELRPQGHDKAPIIRTLNALSEKLLAHVKPSDVDASAPIGMNEASYYESLRLRDLASDPEQNRIILNIRDQSAFFSDPVTTKATNTQPTIDPATAIHTVCADLAQRFPQSGTNTIPLDPFPKSTNDSDYNEEEEEQNTSESPATLATTHIIHLITQNRTQTLPVPSSSLSPAIHSRLLLTHATTLEFLSQFYSAFLSGSPSRTGEIASLIESLKRSVDRMDAVAQDAENERLEIIAKSERQVELQWRQSGKRGRVNYERIGGGREVVGELLGPVRGVVGRAVGRYQEALRVQMGGA
jgi:transcription initiation factor TFIIH subunit 1